MTGCLHHDFLSEVVVARLAESDDVEPVAYSASIKTVCAGCGEPFVWIGGGKFVCPDGPGLPVGLLPNQASVSVDGQELRVPLRPASKPPGWGEDGPGYTVEILGGGEMSGG